MQAAIVVFAAGNRSRGDDAIGPVLLERLAPWLAAEGRSREFALIDDYQLQIEHALDLQGRQLALFIDAGTGTPAPFAFHPVSAVSDAVAGTTHRLSPQEVLGVYRKIGLADPPACFVLCVRGERFELGAGMSDAARANLESAWRHLARLCARPDAALWRSMATQGRDQNCPDARGTA